MTPEAIATFNASQADPKLHPLTCGNPLCEPPSAIPRIKAELKAYLDGVRCPWCGWRQPSMGETLQTLQAMCAAGAGVDALDDQAALMREMRGDVKQRQLQQCERCGGTGTQEAGMFDTTTQRYDAPAGRCDTCGGIGVLVMWPAPIPVSERLPVDKPDCDGLSVQCLVWCDGDWRMARYDHEAKCWEDTSTGWDTNVTHWLPLPPHP